MKDLQGREYARLSQLVVGDKVQVDGDFTCLPKDAVRTVRCRDGGELFITCKEVEHGLIGQLADDGDTLIGVYKL